ncbi:DUF4926 domain-containing protein [Eubacteriales bacterium OttesenSCG-928-K08]|nr:DUF4926 domain-containing protein [Eubacteriales bacterium OttesenSCG-928-K08]
MLKLLDVVHLKADDPDVGVFVKDTGTIVDVLSDGIYTVEFIDDKGHTNMEALAKVYCENELAQ